MAESKKLSGLTRTSVITRTDLLYAVLNPGTTPLSRGILLSDLIAGQIGSTELKTGVISGFSEEATPAAGHMILALVGGVLKKIDIGNMAGIEWSDPVSSDVIPDTDNVHDLGSSSLAFAQVFTGILDLAGSSIDAFLDENDMASDSASALISQQSAKAYIDLVRSVSETANFTVGATHKNKTARCSHASGMNANMPSNTTYNAPIGFKGIIEQDGAGQVTFTDDSGAATIKKPKGFNAKTAGPNSPVYYEKVAADTWKIVGDLEVATQAPSIVTTTPRALVLADNSIPIVMDLATANQVDIPAAASVAFPDGAKIPVFQKGAGVTTIQAAAGVSLNGVVAGGCTISTQHHGVLLYHYGSDAWSVSGDHGTVA